MATSISTYDEERDVSRHFPSGRELAAIALFWFVFGALSVTNWFFPPWGEEPSFTVGAVLIGFFAPILWMFATPPLFWLTSRYSVERGDRSRRLPTIFLYLLIGLSVAFVVDVAGAGAQQLRAASAANPGQPPRDHPFWSFTRARLLNDYTVCLAVIAAGVARDYFARYHRRLEESTRLRAQLAEARLTALQSQLNPHFLFNTLNAVSALVERDPRGVRRMIARLSELLRATLEPSSDPEVTVAREIEILERYLEILRIRFEGRLETLIDADQDTRDALVPPMILQPLVENAMKHAVSKTSGASRIDVSVKRQGDTLTLAVRDTGPGDGSVIPAGSPQEGGMGIGLRNTRERLTGIYDDAYSLNFDRTPEGGALVTIQLPYHTAADIRAIPSPVRAVG